MFDHAPQLEVFPTNLHLRRIDPAKNMRRLYRLQVQRDLFGGASLVREWGRLGCPQPTISRMENLPTQRDLIRMARNMVHFYCQSFARVPQRIVLDIDDTFDTAHGHQQLRLFNAYYYEYGFQPIVVFARQGGRCLRLDVDYGIFGCGRPECVRRHGA